jgi:hypothetical protein
MRKLLFHWQFQIIFMSSIHSVVGVISITDLTPSHICTCLKQGHGFQMSYFLSFLCSVVRYSFCWYWWNCDHHCLSFLFIGIVYRTNEIPFSTVYAHTRNHTILLFFCEKCHWNKVFSQHRVNIHYRLHFRT